MLKRFLKKIHQAVWRNRLARVPVSLLLRGGEALVFGTRLRESVLVGLLGSLHRSQFRRDWLFYPEIPPHFYNQRWSAYRFAYGDKRGIQAFTRGFLAAEVVQKGDRLLDIGCGDGFFSKSFFSDRCARIDAVDIEPSAISTARRLNPGVNIDYRVLDAVREDFPASRYDVIVWDGAIGHFSNQDMATMLKKISRALSPDGIFVGSESLGTEGDDHLQHFATESDLAAVFRPYFKHVLIRTNSYPIPGGQRWEAYWRCANSLATRHVPTEWRNHA